MVYKSRTISGRLAINGGGGLAGMKVEVVRNEMREESEWRSYSTGDGKTSNPYFTPKS